MNNLAQPNWLVSKENSNLPIESTTRSENVQKTLDSYGNPASFIRIFSPKVQMYAAEHKRNAFLGKAPSLAIIRETYGKNLLESVLELHIEDLNDFCGTDKKIEGLQSQQLASMIATEYYYMKISEVALFFYYFKTGRYGKFYGAMDALTIMEAIHLFAEERRNEISRFRAEDEAKEREKRYQQWQQNAITREEYLRQKAERQKSILIQNIVNKTA